MRCTASLSLWWAFCLPGATGMHGHACFNESTPAETTIITNDFGSNFASVGSVPLQEGTFIGCSNSHGDAQGDDDGRLDFHHDSATAKGQVKALYAPLLTQCGCYQIAEWHPGGSGAPTCFYYLPRSAPVKIRDAAGKQHTLLIDQSIEGARWNSLGCFDLAAGPQEIVASNDGATDCLAGVCYWIADAFRLEWVGASCDDATSGTSPQATCALGRSVRQPGQPTAFPGSSASPTAAGPAAPRFTRADERTWGSYLYMALAVLVAALAGWAFSCYWLLRRVRLASRFSVKYVYLRPDSWPMQVINPDGGSHLTVPLPPTELRFTEMAPPSTPLVPSEYGPSSRSASRPSSRPASAAASAAASTASSTAASAATSTRHETEYNTELVALPRGVQLPSSPADSTSDTTSGARGRGPTPASIGHVSSRPPTATSARRGVLSRRIRPHHAPTTATPDAAISPAAASPAAASPVYVQSASEVAPPAPASPALLPVTSLAVPSPPPSAPSTPVGSPAAMATIAGVRCYMRPTSLSRAAFGATSPVVEGASSASQAGIADGGIADGGMADGGVADREMAEEAAAGWWGPLTRNLTATMHATMERMLASPRPLDEGAGRHDASPREPARAVVTV